MHLEMQNHRLMQGNRVLLKFIRHVNLIWESGGRRHRGREEQCSNGAKQYTGDRSHGHSAPPIHGNGLTEFDDPDFVIVYCQVPLLFWLTVLCMLMGPTMLIQAFAL